MATYRDTNGDVGGIDPNLPSDPDPATGNDGYEVEIQVEGTDVYARVVNGNNFLELAVRQSLVGSPANAGSLRGWAAKGNVSHQNMYFHDQYTAAELGSPCPTKHADLDERLPAGMSLAHDGLVIS